MPPHQRRRVAEALAAIEEVPDAPVVEAVHVARRAAEIPLAGHARVIGVAEQLLAVQHLGGQLLVGDQIDLADETRRVVRARQDAAHVVHEEVPRRVPEDEQALLGPQDRRDGPLRSPHAGDEVLGVAVPHLDHVRPVDRHEGIVAQGTEAHVTRQVSVIEIDAPLRELFARVEVEDRDERAHGVVLGEREAIPLQPARHVVLLPRDPGFLPVGGDRHGEEVVGEPPALHAGVLGRGVLQEIHARDDVEGRRVDLVDFSTTLRGDEARQPEVLLVAAQADAPQPGRDETALAELPRRRVEPRHLARRHQGRVGVPARAEDDPHRLARVGQAEEPRHLQRVQIDDGDRVIGAVNDPELPVGGQGDRHRLVEHGDLRHGLQSAGVDDGHRVVVRVGRDDVVPLGQVRERAGALGRASRGLGVHRVHEGAALEPRVVPRHDDDRVVPRRRVGVRHRGGPLGELRRLAVTEGPADLDGSAHVRHLRLEAGARPHEGGGGLGDGELQGERGRTEEVRREHGRGGDASVDHRVVNVERNSSAIPLPT